MRNPSSNNMTFFVELTGYFWNFLRFVYDMTDSTRSKMLYRNYKEILSVTCLKIVTIT